MSKLHLRTLVFVSGATVMAVEMTGLRLLAPYLGTSLIVTTILIGSMMAFLSLGYWLGGRRGDKDPTLRGLCRVTSVAALLVVVIPFAGRPILKAASSTILWVVDGGGADSVGTGIAIIAGGLLGILALFALPVTLMGMVSPWAVRLDVETVEGAGGTAGRLYALSTVGSILGSFLPALVLIPLLGVRNTFLGVGFALLAVSAAGALGRTKGPALACLLLPLAILPQGITRPSEGLVMEAESLYHYIRINIESYGKCDRAKHLYLNEGVAIHSVKCLEEGQETRGYWAYLAAGPLYLDDPESVREVLIIGLAGGTVARHVLDAFPKAHIDGIEIDGAVVRAGIEHFDNGDPRITPYVMDGRTWVQHTDKTYDVVLVDAFRQPYVPFHLTTVEFWEQLRAHMNEQSVVAVNVASVRGSSDRLLRMTYRTLREVFPTVHQVAALRSNDILFASAHPTNRYQITDGLAGLPRGTNLDQIRKGLRNKVVGEVDGWEQALLLTDDKAPVELAWDLMAFEYATQ